MKPGPTKTTVRCSECEAAFLEPKVVDHDVGALLGMEEVRVTNLPALVCPRCGAVSVDGGLLDRLAIDVGALLLEMPTLDGIEVRYLRKLLGDTQAELAEKLGVDRATINRWENSPTPLDGAQAYALRTHGFLRLRGRSPKIEAMAGAFLEKPKPPQKKRRGYRLDAGGVRAA